MPIPLKNHLTFAGKKDRDEYVKILNEFFQNNKDSKQSHQSTVPDDAINKLQDALRDAIKQINPSILPTDYLFNNMQMTALLAYEAEFFKIIAEKGDDTRYIDIYVNLYGEGTNFQKQLNTFGKKDYFLDQRAIYGNPSNNPFYAKLELQKKISDLLSQVKSEGRDEANNKKQIMLPEADEHAAVSFLSNIDPQLMTYIVVNNPIIIQLEKHKKIDILHEGMICMKVLCLTLIDIGKFLAPATALGTSAFVCGGLSLPLAVGVALMCLSVELSYYKGKSIDSTFDQMQVNMMKNQFRQHIDESLSGKEVNLAPTQLWSPMQLLNVENILKGITEYIYSSYKQNKKKFQENLPEVLTSLEDLIKYNYLEYKEKSREKTVSKAALQQFKDHSNDLLGITLNIM